MKRTVVAASLLLALSASTAGATAVGVEVFGGVAIPVVQEDNNNGPMFGIRVPVTLPSVFTIEGFYSRIQGNQTEKYLLGEEYTRSGYDVSAFGANLILGQTGGSGFSFFPYAGIMSNRLSRPGGQDFNNIGFDFGLGVGFSITPMLWIDARAEGAMIITESDNTSRKYGNLNVGIGYNFYASP
jgi:hypothetical protein